ncbi:MAG TPA: hypothetical protein VK907_03755 [Phnomibacter sp.]|nr:hypothetical protein [Phnomibacter sp.]
MTLSVEVIKMVQGILNEKGYKAGTVDGIAGGATLKALNKMKGLPANWTVERKMVGTIQLYAQERGIDPGKIDGFWGPRTQAAYDAIKHQLLFGVNEDVWRPEEVIVPANPNNWPRQTLAELNAFYGPARQTGNPNLVLANMPYPMVIAWDPAKTVKRITCHKMVKDSIIRILTNVHDHYGMQQIRDLRLDYFGGCFNYRNMRGGSQPSTHSWGIALDFDPERNQLKWGRDRASLARPEYNRWWEFWEAEGWVSLGRSRNFDWMHVQAAKLTS